jgi:hypothetical protein
MYLNIVSISQAPILPPNVIKKPFEGNSKYRTYCLAIQQPDGEMVPYTICQSDGSQSRFYREEFVNGRWIYRDEIPHDAYVKKVLV